MVASSSKLTSKVKKLVLADQRIGKVAKKSFNALGIATELFACQLFKSMSDLACDYEPNPRILKAEHLKCVAKWKWTAPTERVCPGFAPPYKLPRRGRKPTRPN